MAAVLQIPANKCLSSSKPISFSAPTNGKINRLFCVSISSYDDKSLITRFRVRALKDKTEEIVNPSSAEEVTKKYGLEAGLWKIFTSKQTNEENKETTTKSKGDQAKELLAKYGGAYLATSITLSLISFGLCYFLISAGVDVQALLQKVGISTNETGEKVGTFALAYAAHKAASPIRFPPTVALTPVVASWIGKKVDRENDKKS
ncbi:Protein of unknown function (DUF1279 [Striga hermonthica]|uniref:DUF1279 domain-containing protein n=1 Tax=Striga hermonthica TaxID=68872 RepID=A0A9N7NQY8_STRHE|nr:Protein of unknown function (DUF1279 [Striga hermonthica]